MLQARNRKRRSIAHHALRAIDTKPRYRGEDAHGGDAVEDAVVAIFLFEIAEDRAGDETAQRADRVDDASGHIRTEVATWHYSFDRLYALINHAFEITPLWV